MEKRIFAEKPRSKIIKQNQTAGFSMKISDKYDKETPVYLLIKGLLGATYT